MSTGSGGTEIERLRDLAVRAQRLTDQSELLARRAQFLAERQRIYRNGVPLAEPLALERVATQTALELEELNAELTTELEQERARLAAILNTMADAVLVVDAAGTPVLTNRAFDDLFGAKGWVAVDEQGVPLQDEENLQQRAAHGEPFYASFCMQRGEVRRWCEASGRPLHFRGELHGVVVIRDITDRALRRLQERFLSLASHELRTPLTPLTGYLQMIQRSDDGERSQHYAVLAQHEVKRLNLLVNDLLDVGRLQSGKLHIAAEPLDLCLLLERACATARLDSPTPPIHLTAPPHPVMVCGDAMRLEQIILNLLTNAITYAVRSPAIDVRLREQGDNAVVEVKDEGLGIPATVLPRLFEPFYQVEGQDTTSRRGLGLGLYLCKQLVAAHNGSIDARSQLGKGSTFIVRLPLLVETGSGVCQLADADVGQTEI